MKFISFQNYLIFPTLLLLLSCKQTKFPDLKEKEVKKDINLLNEKDLEFKNWMKDTLKLLGKESYNEYQREIKVDKDSLSLQLIKKYDIEINKNSKSNSKEIIYALDLLESNKEMPTKTFHMEFIVDYYFYVSSVEQLKRNFDTEISKFVVSFDKRQIEYKFMKGNLIDKIEKK